MQRNSSCPFPRSLPTPLRIRMALWMQRLQAIYAFSLLLTCGRAQQVADCSPPTRLCPTLQHQRNAQPSLSLGAYAARQKTAAGEHPLPAMEALHGGALHEHGGHGAGTRACIARNTAQRTARAEDCLPACSTPPPCIAGSPAVPPSSCQPVVPVCPTLPASAPA